MGPRETWAIWDTSRDRPGGMASYPTEESAQRAIDQARRNVEKGRRPDLADVIDLLVPRRVR